MICGIHHIAIICSNKQKSIAFYSALGFLRGMDAVRPQRQDEIVMMHGYGTTLELFIDPRHPARPTFPEALGLRHLALRVTDIDNVIRSLAESGYEAEPVRRDTFTGGKMTFLKDPDGLPIELHE